MVYGGTIKPGKGTCGKYQGSTLDVVSVYQSYGEALAGKISEKERLDVIEHACPGPGACGGMYTANTSKRCRRAEISLLSPLLFFLIFVI